MNLNGVEYYYIRNVEEDIIGLFDKAGTQVVSYTYDSWGKLISTTGTLASTVGAKNPYRYRGYRYDTESGLYYLNSRYYNPEWGRFINADGIIGRTGELLSHNMYAYCINNPINKYDPSGYNAEDWFPDGSDSIGPVTGFGEGGGGGEGGVSGEGFATEPFLEDAAYEKNLPPNVEPGIKYEYKYDEYGGLKQIKFYDEYGRTRGWVDFNDHGFPDCHVVPHWHVYIYNQTYPNGIKYDYRMDSSIPETFY